MGTRTTQKTTKGKLTMMTRKDYVKTAEILFMFQHAMSVDAHQQLIEEFADMFEKDNANFDRDIFAKAAR